MINKIIKKCSFLVILAFILFSSQFILIKTAPNACADTNLWDSQEGIKDIGQNSFGGENPKDIREITANIIKVFLSILGIIFVVLILLAGYKYMTAQGNDDKVNEAISQIKTGIIGLVIILASYAITSYMMDCVLDITSGSTVWMCK